MIPVAAAGLSHVEMGSGIPVVALHGAYSSGIEARGFIEPALAGAAESATSRLRRLYPDLPGMGDSTAVVAASAQEAIDRLEHWANTTLRAEPFALIGHSLGAHLAAGLAARLPERVRGLALLCPLVPEDHRAETAEAVRDDGAAAALPDEVRADFESYFVVRTRATVERYRQSVAPAAAQLDQSVVAAVLENWQLDPSPADRRYDGPVLVMTGRRDNFVGFRQQELLLDRYRSATSVIVGDAGHALPHECPDLLAAALNDWLARVDT